MNEGKQYKALLQERSDLINDGKNLFDLAEKEGRDLTEDEKARDDEINARLEVIGADIQRHERRRERERTSQPLSRITDIRLNIEEDTRRGFADMADFANSIREFYTPGGRVDERLQYLGQPTNFHRETGSDEGRMVPPEFRREIFEAVREGDDNLLGMVDAEPTSSNAVEMIRDESTPWGASGVQSFWRGEGTKMSPSKLDTDGEMIKLNELYAFVLATGELAKDAPRLAERLTRKSGLAIRYKLNEAIVNGSGTGMPMGWFTSGAKVVVSKESGQAAATVVPQNISKMFARLIGLSQGVWFINQDVLPQLITLNISGTLLYMPPQSGFQGAPGGTLLGRPVFPLENCATLGTVGDIQFVNPKGYWAAHQGLNPEFASSPHLYFDYNIEAFRWMLRAAGQLFLSAPITPAKGSSTRAHVVVLETRS